jgi:hypothetical protein
VCLVFIWKFVPETRGKTLEQIERELFGSQVTAYTAAVARSPHSSPVRES